LLSETAGVGLAPLQFAECICGGGNDSAFYFLFVRFCDM
jgi:hypothetical protein